MNKASSPDWLVALAVALGSALGLASPAQAYPDTPPTIRVSPRRQARRPADTQAAAAASSSESLPNTGGPNADCSLGGGVALVARWVAPSSSSPVAVRPPERPEDERATPSGGRTSSRVDVLGDVRLRWRLVLLGCSSWSSWCSAYQAVRTVLALREAKNDVTSAQRRAAPRRRPAAVKQSLRDARDQARDRARPLRQPPVGRAPRQVPVIGDDVDAVQVMARARSTTPPATRLPDAPRRCSRRVPGASTCAARDGTVRTSPRSRGSRRRCSEIGHGAARRRRRGRRARRPTTCSGRCATSPPTCSSQLDSTLSVAKGGVTAAAAAAADAGCRRSPQLPARGPEQRRDPRHRWSARLLHHCCTPTTAR